MRPRWLSRRPRRAAVLGVVSSLAISAAAFAYWTSTGTGTASATAISATAVTVSPGVPSAALYPGGQADVALTISNPNPYSIRVGALTLDTAQGTTGFAVDAGHAACGVTSLSFTAQSNGGSGWTVPPKAGGVNGSLDVDLVTALSMVSTAADSCQGATFTVYLHAEPDYLSTVLHTGGLVSYWRLGGIPSSADSFTGTGGTALTSHTGEAGATWAHQTGASSSVLTAGGRARKSGTGGLTLDYVTATPPSADYTVEADLYDASNLAGDEIGVVGRLSTGAGTYYKGWFNRADNGWYISKNTAGGSTNLGSWTAGGALTVTQTYRVRLDISGTATTTLKLYVDGTLRVSATDSSSPYTAAGKAGLADGSTGSSATKSDALGLHADNFRVVTAAGTAVTDSKGANNGTFAGAPVLNEPGAVTGDLNRAVRWNATDSYATIPDAAPLRLGDGPFTLEAWVRRLDNGTGKQTLLGKGAGSYQWAFNSNKIGLYKDGGSLIAESAGTQTDTTAFHHYVVTRNGNAVKIYVDGADVTGSITAQSLTDTAAALTIGGRGSSDLLNGVEDEVAVYNTVLSAAVVADHYHIGRGS